MNPEFDKEIDALLRRDKRTAAGGRAGDDGRASTATAHLDADELSAFAEQALPAASRSLYVSHLADCAECRRAVAGLASASGILVESKRKVTAHVNETKTKGAWSGWLNALFAARVLNYAVPALALCLVGAIAFVVLRSRNASSEFVAQRSSDEQKSGGSIKEETPATAAPGAGLTEGANQNTKAPETDENNPGQTPARAQISEAPAVGAEAQPKGALASAPVGTILGTDTAPPPAPPAAVAVDDGDAVRVEGGAAPAPKAVAKETGGKARAAEEPGREQKTENNYAYERGQNQETPSRGAQPRKVEIDQSPDGSRGTQRSDSNTVSNRAGNSLPMLGRQQQQRGEDEQPGAATASRRPRAPSSRESRDAGPPADAETRGVSGHKFRRQGGAWVDVNYTSQPMTGVRRGSDGYRALVADLPEIGRIAGQLQGEFIVVVKGRAYRVR